METSVWHLRSWTGSHSSQRFVWLGEGKESICLLTAGHGEDQGHQLAGV